MSQEGERVLLNVYDLSQGLARQLSSSLLGKVIDGIWHTGVVVHGCEYYFGGGIQRAPVGQTPYGRPLKVLDLGYTQVPKDVFEEYLNEISPRFTQATYNVLRHNCNNFSEEVVQFLVGNGIPQYILGLPDEVMNSPMGAMLLPMIQQLETTLKHNQAPAVPQQVAASGVPNFSSIQVPSSVGIALSQTSSSPQLPMTTSGGAASTHVSSVQKSELVESAASEKEAMLPAGSETMQRAVSLAEQPQQQDALRDARAKVQEEIKREFMDLMASGSLRASEAAALAARRVMAKHGILTN